MKDITIFTDQDKAVIESKLGKSFSKMTKQDFRKLIDQKEEQRKLEKKQKMQDIKKKKQK